MSDLATPERLIDRLLQHQDAIGATSSTDLLDIETTDDLGSWGLLRGIKARAVMLEFRLRSGHLVAFSYAYLERVTFDPGEGIALHFTGAKPVLIRGRRLNDELRAGARLFDGVIRHRVAFIRERDLSATVPAGPAIDHIVI